MDAHEHPRPARLVEPDDHLLAVPLADEVLEHGENLAVAARARRVWPRRLDVATACQPGSRAARGAPATCSSRHDMGGRLRPALRLLQSDVTWPLPWDRARRSSGARRSSPRSKACSSALPPTSLRFPSREKPASERPRCGGPAEWPRSVGDFASCPRGPRDRKHSSRSASSAISSRRFRRRCSSAFRPPSGEPWRSRSAHRPTVPLPTNALSRRHPGSDP